MYKPILGVITPINHIPNLSKKLEKYFDLIYFPDSSYDDLCQIIDKIEYIFTNPNKLEFSFDEYLLNKAINLKVFATASTGDSHVDVRYLEKAGVKFISLKGRDNVINNLSSTAELAFLFLLSYARKFIPATESVKARGWDYQPFIGERIQDLRIGVIGFGRLGKLFSQYCHNFGAKVGIYDPYKDIDKKYSKFENLNKLFSTCNAISIHVHLNQETKGLVGSELLKITDPNCALINTSRGGIVNEESILKWVSNSSGHFYFTDVLSDENGNIEKSILIKTASTMSQIVITPHIGGMTQQGQSIAYNEIADILINEIDKT